MASSAEIKSLKRRGRRLSFPDQAGETALAVVYCEAYSSTIVSCSSNIGYSADHNVV
jgi:hypothetical protein